MHVHHVVGAAQFEQRLALGGGAPSAQAPHPTCPGSIPPYSLLPGNPTEQTEPETKRGFARGHPRQQGCSRLANVPVSVLNPSPQDGEVGPIISILQMRKWGPTNAV